MSCAENMHSDALLPIPRIGVGRVLAPPFSVHLPRNIYTLYFYGCVLTLLSAYNMTATYIFISWFRPSFVPIDFPSDCVFLIDFPSECFCHVLS